MNSNTLQLTIEIDDRGSAQLKKFGTAAKSAGESGEKSMKGMGTQVEKVNRLTTRAAGILSKISAISLGSVVAGVATLSAGAVKLVADMGQQARETSNLARLTNMSAKKFTEAGFSTRAYGVDMDKLATISMDAHDKIGDFITTGQGGLVDFFETVAPKIGITAQELQNLSGPEVLIKVKQAMDDANLSMEEQIFHLNAMASDTALLIPLLENGGEAFYAQAKRAEQLGLAIDDIETQRLMEAQMKITEVQGVMGALKQHLGAELAPIITDLGERLLTSMAEGEGGVKGLAETIAVKLMQGLGFSIEALRFFHNGWLGIKLVGQTALNVLAHGVENLYKGLRVLLTPLDEIAEFAVWAGALDVNPFDKIEESLGTFSSVTSDVTDQVLDDIERTNAGYDKVGATIDSYVAKLQAAGGGDASATVEAHRVGQTSMTATEQAEADKRRQIAEKLAAEKEALGQSLLEKTNQLTMEELEYKQWALEQEVAQMQQMAGDDQMLQQQILEYRKAALAEFAQESATTNAKMTSDMTTTAKKVSSVFTNNLEGALLDSMGRTENSWSSMLKAMLAKLVAVLAEMAAAWAASQVAQEFGWAGAIHHTGLWSSPGEHIALVEDRELIIPSKQSDGIRQNLGGFAGTGTWDAIEAATAMYNVEDWSGGYAMDLAREYLFDGLSSLLVGMAMGNPGIALPNLVSKETFFNNAGKVYGDKQKDAYDWDGNYAGIGSAMLRALSFFTLGGFNPYADAAAGVVGGKLGNAIGDLLNDRRNEDLIDALEDGLLTTSELEGRLATRNFLGIDDGSNLGSFFDGIKSVYGSAVSSLKGLVSDRLEARSLARAAAEAKAASEQELGTDYTHNISTWSSQYGGPASGINYGTAQSIGYSGGSSGSASYNSSTGGYDTYGGGSAGYGPGLALGGVVRNLMVPHGDHGYAALSYDEGVVDADTMKILSRSIRSGEFGGTSQIVAAVLGLRSDFREFALEIGAYSRKVSEIIDHWQANGLPETRVAA